MSALSAPIYARALGGALLRRPSRFVVTPKGRSVSRDGLRTFRTHLCWAGLLGVSLIASLALGHTHAAMGFWSVLALAITLAPVAAWAVTARRTAGTAPRPAVARPAAAQQGSGPRGSAQQGEAEPALAATAGGG